MQSRTQLNGRNTAKTAGHSPLSVFNKDPNFDYSFQSRAAVEEGGGVDHNGWEALGVHNSNGEEWGGPAGLAPKTKGKSQKVYIDTILCKRSKEVSQYFKRFEDEKYNAQIRFIRDAAKNARVALRELDPGSIVKDETETSSKVFTQRQGPTEGPMPEHFNPKKSLEGK